AAPFGRLTFTPSFLASSTTTLDDTMKMMRRTRKMSVSGVMLISAKRPPPSPLSSSGTLPTAIRTLLHSLQRFDELLDEEPELDGDGGEALVEVVEDDDGDDGDEDAGRRRDERLGDALRHDAEAAAAVLGDGLEGLHDADDGAEEADERGDGADGADDPQPGAEVEVDALPRPVDGGDEGVVARPPLALEADQEDVGERRLGAL